MTARVLKIVLLAKSITEPRKSSSDIEIYRVIAWPCEYRRMRKDVVWRTSECTTGSESVHITMQAGFIVNTDRTEGILY